MDINNLRNSFTTPREFLLALPGNVPEKYLEGVETNFHFDIEGEGGGQYSVLVSENTLNVYEHFEGEPSCVIKAKEKNFMALLRGELNPMMAVFTGKVKISNPGEVMKYAKIFGLM